LFCFISYFAIILDGVHLRRRATSAPDTDSASLLLLWFFVATLCVNKDVYIKRIHKHIYYYNYTVYQ